MSTISESDDRYFSPDDDGSDDEEPGPEGHSSYYALLGLPASATPAEIRRAFLQLSMRYHSDKHTSSTEEEQQAMRERFEELKTAYTVLSDQQERAVYDLKGSRGSAHLALIRRTTQSSQDVVDMIRSLDRAAKLKRMERMLASTSDIEAKYSMIPLLQWWGQSAQSVGEGSEEPPEGNAGPLGSSTAAPLAEEPINQREDPEEVTQTLLADVFKSQAQVLQISLNGKPTIIMIPDQEKMKKLVEQARRRTGEQPSIPKSKEAAADYTQLLKLLTPLALGVRTALPTSLSIQHSFEHALDKSSHVKVAARSSSSQPLSVYTALQWKNQNTQTENKVALSSSMKNLRMTVTRLLALSRLWSLKFKLSLFNGLRLLDLLKVSLLRQLSKNTLLESFVTLSLYGSGVFSSVIASKKWLLSAVAGAGELTVSAAYSSTENDFATELPSSKSKKGKTGRFSYAIVSFPIAGATWLNWKFMWWDSSFYKVGIGFQSTIPYCWSPFAPPYFIVQSASMPVATNTIQFVYERGRHTISIPVAVFTSESVGKCLAWLTAPLVVMRLGILLYHPYAKSRAAAFYAQERQKHVAEMDIARQKALIEQSAIRASVLQSQALEERKAGLVIVVATYGVLLQEFAGFGDDPGSPSIRSFAERPPLLTRAVSYISQWLYQVRRAHTQPSFASACSGAEDSSAEDVPLSLDVTVPLQSLVRDSTLNLPAGTKATLPGFYDPDPYTDERKQLKIIYLFRGKQHMVVLNDEDELLIPQRSLVGKKIEQVETRISEAPEKSPAVPSAAPRYCEIVAYFFSCCFVLFPLSTFCGASQDSSVVQHFAFPYPSPPAQSICHLVRHVDPRGFAADFRCLPKELNEEGKQHLRRVVRSRENAILCGSVRTGKLTLLRRIGEYFEKSQKLQVAYVSADTARANRLGGFLVNHFVGLRLTKDDLPSQEQLEGTFERHARLVQSSLGGCVPSLADIDVLVIDSIEKIPPAVFFAIETVARRVKGKPKVPFGGIRIIAGANFWEMPVVPSSDTGGYLFQCDEWAQFFPLQMMLTATYEQNAKLTSLTERAQFGVLTEADIEFLESLPGVSKKKSSDISSKMMMPLITNFEAITQKAVRFPKQRAVKIYPDKYRQLKQTDIGNFLVNMLIQSTSPLSFGLVDALSLEEGDQVHLLFNGNVPVKAGAVGEVVQVREHYISVHFYEKDKTVDIPRMRVCCYHPDYPDIVYEMRQFPLFPREKLCPLTMRAHPNAYHVRFNGLRLTDTNDLGCLLSRMRDFSDFTMTNAAAFAYLDNMVHEPTRIYYHQLLNRPISSGEEHWCRNCKAFVPTSTFFQHWSDCVKTVRWCPECEKTIPLERLEPHKEKHQLVLCLDCGQSIEWRHWDEHRLSCPMMMREVTPLNEFLPLRTRQLALELGLDKRDLHTMKCITKGSLPKSKHFDARPKATLHDVWQDGRRRICCFLYRYYCFFFASCDMIVTVPILQRFRPFVSSNLDDYLTRYWAVAFTVASRPLETTQIRQYLSWYCTRGKVVHLDHHVNAHTLRHAIIDRTGIQDLPVLFVNKKFVGTISTIQELEKNKLLKDVLQFGFQWKTGVHSSGDLALHTLPAARHDTELFQARYRGTPVARPVVQLPTFHPCCPSRDADRQLEPLTCCGCGCGPEDAEYSACGTLFCYLFIVFSTLGKQSANPGRRFRRTRNPHYVAMVFDPLVGRGAARDGLQRHPSYGFYTGLRPVRLTAAPSGESTEALSCFALHAALLPPSRVECGAVADVNDNLYAEGIASDDGLELLRANWFLLLYLLFPPKFVIDRDLDAGVEDDAASRAPLPPDPETADSETKLDVHPITDVRECLRASTTLNTAQSAMMRSPDVLDRIHYSYIIFLRFFGWRLHDETRGVLDRHRSWEKRYALLSLGSSCVVARPSIPVDAAAPLWCTEAPQYKTFDFYSSGLPVIVKGLIAFRLFRFAVGLVEFLLEEMNAERLLHLHELVENSLLPTLESCKGVDASHTTRLRKKLFALFYATNENLKHNFSTDLLAYGLEGKFNRIFIHPTSLSPPPPPPNSTPTLRSSTESAGNAFPPSTDCRMRAAIRCSCIVLQGVPRLPMPRPGRTVSLQNTLEIEMERRKKMEQETRSRFHIVKEARGVRGKGRTIGIDLGTTNSCVCYIDKETKKPKIIPSPTGSWVFPTAVTFDKNHTIRMYGEEARACVRSSASATLCSGKRLIGRGFGELGKVQSDLQKTNILTVNEQGQIAVEVMGRTYTILHIIAMAKKMMQKRMVRSFVFDLGGGTLDCAIMEHDRHKGTFRLVATHGDPMLGGNDWDTVISDYFARKFEEKWKIPIEEEEGNVGQGVAAFRNLLLESEKAKIHFTHSTETYSGYNRAFHFSSMLREIIPLEATLTHETYVDITRPLRVRCLECVEQLFEHTHLRPEDIDNILLVGAMTRDPPIRRMLEEYFNKPVASSDVCPADYAVAIGAGIRAGMLQGDFDELSRRTRFVSGTVQHLRQGGVLRRSIARVRRAFSRANPNAIGQRWRGRARGLSEEEISNYAKELVEFEAACARRLLLERVENDANAVMRRMTADSNRKQGMQEKRIVQLGEQIKFWQYMVHNFHDHEEELERTVRELETALDELDGLAGDNRTHLTEFGTIDFSKTAHRTVNQALGKPEEERPAEATAATPAPSAATERGSEEEEPAGPKILRRKAPLPTASSQGHELVEAGHPALVHADVPVGENTRRFFMEAQVNERAWREPPTPPGEQGSWAEVKQAMDDGVPVGAPLPIEELERPMTMVEMLEALQRHCPMDDPATEEHAARREHTEALRTMRIISNPVDMVALQEALDEEAAAPVGQTA
eukprot:gene12909-8766_t